MNAYKAQIAALLAQSDKSPLDTAIFLTRRSNEYRRDFWRVSRDEAVEEWIEKDRALFELQLDALYRVQAAEHSDNDLVRLIGGTINDVLDDHSWDVDDPAMKCWGGFYGENAWEGDLDFNEIATAVLAKLRAEGVIR